MSARAAVAVSVAARAASSSAAWATPTARAAMLMLEAAALDPTYEIGGGTGEAIEEELGGIHALVAELGDRLDHLETGGALLHDEAGHAAMPRRGPGIGEGEEGEGVALAAVGDEHLGAGNEVAIAVASSLSADGLDVGARVRLGEAEPSARLATREARQEPASLLLRAVVEHDEGGHGVAVDHSGERHEAAADLLDDLSVGANVEPQTPVGGGHERAEEPELAHARHQLVRIGIGVLEARSGGNDLLVHEAAHRGHDGRSVGEPPRHGGAAATGCPRGARRPGGGCSRRARCRPWA